mgnify:CR=1 FL=1
MCIETVTIDTNEFIKGFVQWYNDTEQSADPALKLTWVDPENIEVANAIEEYEENIIPYYLNNGKSLKEILEEEVYYNFQDLVDCCELPPDVKSYEDNRIYGLCERFQCFECDEETDLKPLGIAVKEFYECMRSKGIPAIGSDDIEDWPIPDRLYCNKCFSKAESFARF